MAQGDDSRSQDLAPRAEYGAPARYYPDDEISLFDLDRDSYAIDPGVILCMAETAL